MYKAVFQNSKIALLFAVITIFSAVSMVGTSEDSGLLPRVVSLVGASRSHDGGEEAQPSSAESKPPSVFGDYASQDAGAGTGGVASTTASGGSGPDSGSGQGFNPMTAAVAPGAVVTASGAISGGPDVPQSELEMPSQ